jgi:SAM-dependent methyltransferase
MYDDQKTANAFAKSWNHLPLQSIYTQEQFEDWLYPITQADIAGQKVLELGCGNGSLLAHMVNWFPARLEGVDLGESVKSAVQILSSGEYKNWKITQADLITFESDGFDFVYCIGVLHHLQYPKRGLDAILRNVKKGGRFHGWVYAREGNALIIWVVDPIRKLASKFPWWFTKYFVATPLVMPYYIYAKGLRLVNSLKFLGRFLKRFPLYEYSLWIAKREFSFFRHVAFDQLVTPQTTYINKGTLLGWLNTYDEVDKESIYIIMRNGNSWKFGGRKR